MVPERTQGYTNINMECKETMNHWRNIQQSGDVKTQTLATPIPLSVSLSWAAAKAPFLPLN